MENTKLPARLTLERRACMMAFGVPFSDWLVRRCNGRERIKRTFKEEGMANQSFGNFWVSLLLKSPLHAMLDDSTLLIRVTGRKTGREITTPVNYSREGEILWVTSRRERQWWRNMRSGGKVAIYLKQRWLEVGAEVIEGRQEVLEAFDHYFKLAPERAKYFGVSLGANGNFDPRDLSSCSEQRIVIRLWLDGAGSKQPGEGNPG